MQSDNQLLNRLDRDTFQIVAKSLVRVKLERGQELARPHDPVHRAYFPIEGTISCVVELPGGGAIETGMIGRDGQWGATQAMDDKVSLNAVIMQIEGYAYAIEVDRLRALTNDLPSFRSLLLRYDQFASAQAQQTAACNAVHTVDRRLCKWLVRLYELNGSDFYITQDFMAQMIGVRRTSVTGHAAELQSAGAITYKRGQVNVENIGMLRSRSCECTADLKSHFDRLFAPAEH